MAEQKKTERIGFIDGKSCRIEVQAFQEFDKPVAEPKKYSFCCWRSLFKWLDDCSDLYPCDACRWTSKIETNKKETTK